MCKENSGDVHIKVQSRQVNIEIKLLVLFTYPADVRMISSGCRVNTLLKRETIGNLSVHVDLSYNNNAKSVQFASYPKLRTSNKVSRLRFRVRCSGERHNEGESRNKYVLTHFHGSGPNLHNDPGPKRRRRRS